LRESVRAINDLADPSLANCRHASQRLGDILKSYTVYVDRILADTWGRLIANG
jgi:hypothetical protein